MQTRNQAQQAVIRHMLLSSSQVPSLPNNVKAPLKWNGGKAALVNDLVLMLPDKIENTYFPCCGAGSMFFEMKRRELFSGKAFLTDKNDNLVNFFRVLRDHHWELVNMLDLRHVRYGGGGRAIFDLAVDELLSDQSTDLQRAAGFWIYNKTASFSAVSKEIRRKAYSDVFATEKDISRQAIRYLLSFGKMLEGTVIENECYTQTFRRALLDGTNSFTFIDPPYFEVGDGLYEPEDKEKPKDGFDFTKFSQACESLMDEHNLIVTLDANENSLEKLNFMKQYRHSVFYRGTKKYEDEQVAINYLPQFWKATTNMLNWEDISPNWAA
ncbi:DNA adenine methylase [Terasakiella pusilla]|uniref:DNA adenine methylase n=1 Tax=Terasakiella pusilla TaxID=64973 RepID=UPI003AA815DE